MKPILLLLGLLTALVVGVSAAQAKVLSNTQDTIPVDLINPCNGEEVTGTIGFHLVLASVTNNGNGNSTLTIHENLDASNLTGANGGNYTIPGAVTEHQVTNPDGTFSFEAVLNETVVSAGPADNFNIKIRESYSFDGTTLTVKRNIFETSCRG
jgi:hypothetical protein